MKDPKKRIIEILESAEIRCENRKWLIDMLMGEIKIAESRGAIGQLKEIIKGQ